MIASAHLAAGLVAGMTAGHYAGTARRKAGAAFVLGLLSHAVLDAIPHSDYATLSLAVVPWIAFGESLALGAVAALIMRRRLVHGWRVLIAFGVGGSVIPDAKFFARLVLPADVTETVVYYGDAFHGWFHADPMPPEWLSLGIEVMCTVTLLTVLAAFPRTGRPAG